jgi:hypothetical protein
MAKDLAGTSVTVNVLVPGGVTNTGMVPLEAGLWPKRRSQTARTESIIGSNGILIVNARVGIPFSGGLIGVAEARGRDPCCQSEGGHIWATLRVENYPGGDNAGGTATAGADWTSSGAGRGVPQASRRCKYPPL